MKLIIETSVGNIPMTKTNILVKDVDDMEELEFWENRLRKLEQDFTIAYRKVKGRIFYTIFTNVRGEGSVF